MNKVLHVCRKVKQYSEKQMADILGITETEYIEFEHSVGEPSASQAMKLSKVFDVEPLFFFTTDAERGQIEQKAADEVQKILNEADFQILPAKLALDMIRLGNNALSISIDLKLAYQKELMLLADIKALTKLNEDFKKLITEQQAQLDRS